MRFAMALNLVGFATLAVTTHGQTLVATMSGAAAERFGASVIPAGFQDADTYTDVLVGVPNAGFGVIRCVSGRYLATGAGPSLLWTLASPPGGNSQFGASLVDAGNLTGDATSDFVVGAPSYRFNPATGPINGALFLVDGATHTIAATIYGFGDTALGGVVVTVGDQNGDGKKEIAATAPALITHNPSQIHVIQGSAFNGTKSLGAAAHSSLNSNGANEFGETLASGFDLDGNGKQDLAIGSPRMFGGSGWMYVVSADNQFTTLAAYSGSGTEHMAASISASHDYNGDGVVDFIVGAPNKSFLAGTEDGRAVVLSGANLRAYTFPYELAVLTNTYGVTPSTNHFGAAVRASPDLNRDGVGDFLVGQPDYHSGGAARGAVVVYSGATLTRIGAVTGAVNDRLGDVILGALQDVDGDLFPEFVVAGSTSDNPVGDCGVVNLYGLFPSAPANYCTGKTNSLGCVPAISWSGSASASSPAPFSVTCSSVINQRSGLLMYSHAPHAGAYQGGTFCVKAPLKRTSQQSSGGSPSGSDCTGTYSFNFTPQIQGGADPTLVTGAEIFCQYWSRDPQDPYGSSLSNALRFVINP